MDKFPSSFRNNPLLLYVLFCYSYTWTIWRIGRFYLWPVLHRFCGWIHSFPTLHLLTDIQLTLISTSIDTHANQIPLSYHISHLPTTSLTASIRHSSSQPWASLLCLSSSLQHSPSQSSRSPAYPPFSSRSSGSELPYSYLCRLSSLLADWEFWYGYGLWVHGLWQDGFMDLCLRVMGRENWDSRTERKW